MRVLSVDLGTSNTVAVLAAHGRPPRVVEVDGSATMPSAVYAAEDGTLVVGRDAERRARLDPTRFEPNPKRRIDEQTLLLGQTVVPVTDALAAVLSRVFEETKRQLGGETPDEVRLTHPAEWGSVRRNVLLSAARLAGINSSLTLVPEPVAAAAHFASFPDRTLAPGQALAVYDLGAGTFDVAVVGATQDGYAVLAEDGLPDLGGLDVDQALFEHVGREVSNRDPARWQRLLRPESTTDRREQRALREDVKAAKEALSRHPQAEVPMPEGFADVLVTRQELEALIRPSMLRSVELLAATVRSTGATPEGLAGIYLVGGSSRIPLVAQLLAERVNVVPASLDQPETAVALGAQHVSAGSMTMRTQAVRPAAAPKPTPQHSGNQYPVPNAPGAAPVAQGGYGGYPQQGPQQIGVQGAMGVPNGMHPGPQPGPNPGQYNGMTGVPQTGYLGQHGMTGPHQPQSPNMTGPASITGPGSLTGPTQVGGLYEGSFGKEGRKADRKRLLLVGGGAVLVIVLVVAGYFVFFANNHGFPSASQCQSGQRQVDGKGFTTCLRQLAGAVADTGACVPENTPQGGQALADLQSERVKCQLGGDYVVEYLHANGQVNADDTAKDALQGISGSQVRSDWSGNELAGHYVAAADDTEAILVFTVKDRPLVGVLSKVGVSADAKVTPDQLADFFEKNVQPGT